MPGILNDLSLRDAPICGRILSPEQIQRGVRYYREGKVLVVVTATILCRRGDMRAGILNWDEYDARTLLENLPMARVMDGEPGVES